MLKATCKNCVCVCVCAHITFCEKSFNFLPKSMWQSLLLDPLLSLFGQSGGRHFKLLLDEVRVVITWLRPSVSVVCTCIWPGFFLSENISREQDGFCCAAATPTSFGFIFCRLSVLGKKKMTALIQQLAQLQFQLFVSDCWRISAGAPVRHRAGAVRCAENTLLCLSVVCLCSHSH